MRKSLSLSLKFALVSAAYTIPIAALLHFMVSEKNKTSEFAEVEVSGNRYLEPVLNLLSTMTKLRTTAAYREAGIALPEGLTEEGLEQRTTALIEELQRNQSELGGLLQLDDAGLKSRQREDAAPEKIASSWKNYTAATGPQKLKNLTETIESVKHLITHVGDTSNLILDPDLDSYYLMDAVLLAIPPLMERIQAAASMHVGLSKKGRQVTPDELTDLKIMVTLLKNDFDHLMASTATAQNEDQRFYGRNESLQREVKDAMKGLSAKMDQLTPRLTEVAKVTSGAFLGEVFNVSAAVDDVLRIDQKVLTELLQARIQDVVVGKWRSLLWVLGCWILSGVLAVLLQRSVTSGIKKVFVQLKSSADEIRTSSVKLHSSAQRSASAASQEAAAIQESVAAMAEMTSMLSQTSLHTQSASSTATDSIEHAQSGMQIMQNMATSMSQIASSNSQLQEITKIIEDIASRTNVINDIVFKTQLLAVNASIEAARAGHHGKGFAVVANEVANLASLSGKAAAEIRQLLDDSRSRVTSIVGNTGQNVENGQKIARDAIEAFEGISGAISSIHDKVQQIFDATREQETGVKQTTQAMTELNIATTSNNTLARENATLSDHIRGQSERLYDIERAMTYVVFGKESVETHKRNRKLSGVDAILGESSTPGVLTSSSPEVEKQPVGARTSIIRSDTAPVNRDIVRPISSAKARLAAKIAKKGSSGGSVTVGNVVTKASVSAPSHTNIGAFSWQPSYDIGVEPMNDDHKRLLKLMADLESAYKAGSSIKEQFAILEELKDFTVKHFRQEEAFMESIKYPELATHKMIHQNLLERFGTFVTRYRAEGKLEDEFFGFLRSWLTAHIMGIDVKYGEFARNDQKSA